MVAQTMAYARQRAAEAPILTAPSMPRPLAASGVHRLELFSDFAAAEPHWRALEANGVYTPYQRFDWMDAWQNNAGAAESVSPLLLASFDRAGHPLFLLPLGYVTSERCKIVRFLGGKHANYNFGPWRRDFSCGAAGLRALIDWLYHVQPELDGVELLSQPESWDGMQNPFLALPHQPSPSDGYKSAIEGSADEVLVRLLSNSMRGRIRNKERRLQKLPGYRYTRAATEADVDRYLAAFLEQKAARLKAQGIENVFAEPGVAEFLRECCLIGQSEGKPVIEMHALECDGDVLAMFAGVSDGRYFSSMFNSYTLSDNARFSPGLVLLVHLVRNCAERGIKIFDLGVGEAEYKKYFCDSREILFDSYFGLSTRGQAYVAAISAGAAIKRWIKRSPALMRLALAARRLRAGKPESGGETA